MVTGVNGAQSTQKADAPQSKAQSQQTKDTEALKTLLTLIFTLAAANNHNSTLATAGRYGAAAGQALILMNHQTNPFAHNNVVEKLVDNLADALGKTSDERQKPQEPVSLIERNNELKELKAQRKAKKSQIKSEIKEVAGDLGIKTSNASKAKKKAKAKTRTKSFEAAINKLNETKSQTRTRLQNAQINGNEIEEAQAQRDLELIKVQERVFSSVPKDQRSQKSSLQKVTKVNEVIQKQIANIQAAKEPAQTKGFLGFFKKTDTNTTQARQRAIETAQNTIAEVRTEAGLQGDATLTRMINSLAA